MEADVYQPGPGDRYNAQVVTKLLNNYRSHSAILKQPNDLFYNSELRVSGAAWAAAVVMLIIIVITLFTYSWSVFM